jgi:D-alanyl-D-alanine carboxypeptidase/D-alanyl-D-alanine-endopeptidase (penicillin-binding protein 4)
MSVDSMKRAIAKTQSRLKFGACALTIALLPQLVFAAKMRAQCYLLDKEHQSVHGVDIHHPYEIASVSKIFTSFWALSALGANYRFPTKIYVRPVGKGVVDMHIEGGWDPYFNRDQFQYLITQLNALNITHIAHLTFDENFKFTIDSRGVINHNIPLGHYQLNDPTPQQEKENLQYFARSIRTGYAKVRKEAKALRGMDLPATITMQIDSIDIRSWTDFERDFDFLDNSRKMVLQSIPLYQILKEMNRNSNNYVANLIFQSLGGAAEFARFAGEALKIPSSEVRFVNGSGDSLETEGGKKAYNRASCDAVVRMIANFRTVLRQQNLELENVMALAGEDASAHEKSTVSNIYGSEATADALIAKTGTVDPAVSLAGMASTEEGDVYFGIIYGTNGRKSDWASARTKIRQDVIEIFKKFRHKKAIKYDAAGFLAFDSESRLRELNPSKADLGNEQMAMASRKLRYFVTPDEPVDIIYSEVKPGRLP